MIDRVRVVGPHDREPGRLSGEVTRVVATLLIGMPAPSVDFDNDPSLDQQVDAANPRDGHLTDALQARIDQGLPNQRLDTRLRSTVEQRCGDAVTSRNPLEQVLDLAHADQTHVKGTVEHGNGEATWLAPHHVHESVDETRSRGLNRLDERPPVPHSDAAGSRASAVEVNVQAGVGWAP